MRIKKYQLGKIFVAVLLGGVTACVTPSKTQVKPWQEMENKNIPAGAQKVVRELPKVQIPPPPRENVRPKPVSVKTQPIAGARVSPAKGPEKGFIVLWPRIIPSKNAGDRRLLATKLQTHLRSAVTRVAGGRPVDVRPEPERACPQSGCEATAANVLLLHHSRGCAAVGLVTPPGPYTTHLVPLAGNVTLKTDAIPFRDFPESQVVVHDFVPCDDVMAELGKNTPKFEALVRTFSGGS